MAKKKHTDPVSERNGRLIRTEAYAEKVRQLFAATVNEILTLNKTMPDIANGVMYSFDGDTKKVQQKVEMLLRRLHSVATMAIQKGIALEWDEAERACDAMVKSCFGKELMSNPKFKAWTAHNGNARDAFVRRSDKGLNLSQRIWRDVRALRDEMEVAITVAMGEGEDAGTISRQVRQYLNDPDLMFRRFQYHEKEAVLDADGNPVLDKYGKPKMQDKLGKDGKPIVKKKWKKRIADPDKPGHYKWIDYDRDSYAPKGAGGNSRGVYRSAAKNAMRVARTETNMAYRAADHERWMTMDFVLGIHIETSNSHAKKMPKGDICDRLEGDYPKDFDFCGWHPQCFCHATPILPSDDEMVAMAEAYDQGKPYKPKGVIRDYPDGFKDWVRENEDKLTDPGLSNPYFVSNNEQDIIKILRGEEIAEPELSIEEAAAIRHANRTPEQIADIQARWDARNAKIEAEKQAAAKLQREHEATSKYGQSILGIMDGVEGVDTSALKMAMQGNDFAAIMQEAAALKAIGKQIKKTAGNVLKKAAEYGDVDVSALQAIMDAGKIGEMKAATKALAQQILKQKQFEQSISDLIPDAHEWHKTFTAAELQATYNAVQKKIADLETKYPGNIQKQIDKLEWEANTYLGTDAYGAQSKYKTWKVSQAAYLKKAEALKALIYFDEVAKKLPGFKSFKTTSAPYLALIPKLEIAIANKDKVAVDAILKDLQDRQNKIIQDRLNKIRKSAGAQFSAHSYTQERKDKAVWDKVGGQEADDALRGTAGKAWRAATEPEKDYTYEYTYHYCNINEPLQGRTYCGSQTRGSFTMKVEAITSYIDRNKLPCDMWFQRGDSSMAVIESRIRFAGGKMPANIEDLVGMVMQEGGFMSTGSRSGGFSSNPVIINIYAPKGTRAAYIEPISQYGNGAKRSWDGKSKQSSFGYEDETLFQRGTRMLITKVEKVGGTVYLDVEILGCEVRDLAYVKDSQIGY